MSKNGKNRPTVSVLNWMGSLILYAIPGVNLIFLILSIIFAKTAAKRNFAIAGLILMVLAVVLVFAAFLALPEQLTRLAIAMRDAGRAVYIP